MNNQPPSGGCVLKHDKELGIGWHSGQPPSGGCVLKHQSQIIVILRIDSAAFGRLCVETNGIGFAEFFCNQPPSGGCVLKPPMIRPNPPA